MAFYYTGNAYKLQRNAPGFQEMKGLDDVVKAYGKGKVTLYKLGPEGKKLLSGKGKPISGQEKGNYETVQKGTSQYSDPAIKQHRIVRGEIETRGGEQNDR
jgi:hypothetical protein